MLHCAVLCVAGGLCSLTIDKALPEDEGQYKCRAENSAGRAESSCTVLVDGENKALRSFSHLDRDAGSPDVHVLVFCC